MPAQIKRRFAFQFGNGDHLKIAFYSTRIDNFDLAGMREAVALNAGRAILEVSGGVNLDTVRDIAATGVDRISIGALTKDVKATDFSMRFEDL